MDLFATLFYRDSSRNYLKYPIDMTPQSNNDTTGSRFINNMTSPHIWLAQENITEIQWGNITQYLILEWIDLVGHAILFFDGKISSLVKPPDVVWM